MVVAPNSDPALDAVLLSMQQAGASPAEIAQFKLETMKAYVAAKFSGGSAPRAPKSAEDHDSTATLESETTKSQRKAKAFAVQMMGEFKDPANYLGPWHEDLISFVKEAQVGKFGDWAKKKFETWALETPGITNIKKDFLGWITAATAGQNISQLEGTSPALTTIRAQFKDFAFDVFLSMVVCKDATMNGKGERERNAKVTSYRKLVTDPISNEGQSMANAFNSALTAGHKDHQMAGKRVKAILDELGDEESGDEETAVPPPKQRKVPTSTLKTGPGIEGAATEGKKQLNAMKGGNAGALPEGFNSIWSKAERFAYTRAAGLCDLCATEGYVVKGLKDQHKDHVKPNGKKKGK